MRAGRGEDPNGDEDGDGDQGGGACEMKTTRESEWHVAGVATGAVTEQSKATTQPTRKGKKHKGAPLTTAPSPPRRLFRWTLLPGWTFVFFLYIRFRSDTSLVVHPLSSKSSSVQIRQTDYTVSISTPKHIRITNPTLNRPPVPSESSNSAP